MKDNVVPVEVSSKFNWGACLLSSIWCIRYGVWRIIPNSMLGFFLSGILILINPWFLYIGILSYSIYFGFKANTWAWRIGNFTSAKEYLRVQKLWGISGLVFYSTVFILVMYTINYSPAINVALAIGNNNSYVTDFLGSSITKQFSIRGKVYYMSDQNNPITCVDLKVKGNKNSGYLIIDAMKVNDLWVPARLILKNLNDEILVENINEDMLSVVNKCSEGDGGLQVSIG